MRKKEPVEKEWDTINFMIFDAPLIQGTFEERLKYAAYEINKTKDCVAMLLK